jgi:hypothetical protein
MVTLYAYRLSGYFLLICSVLTVEVIFLCCMLLLLKVLLSFMQFMNVMDIVCFSWLKLSKSLMSYLILHSNLKL